MIARGPDSRYVNALPWTGRCCRTIEVADSSVLEDRRNKGATLRRGRRYHEFWLINLQSKHVEIYSNPQAGRDAFYKTKVEYSAGEAIPSDP